LAPALLDTLVGACFCLFGLATWRRTTPAPALLMVATGVLWFVGGPFGLAAFAHRGPLIHLLVGYPRGRLRGRAERAAVTLGYLAGLIYPVGRSAVATIVLAGSVAAITARGYRRSRGAQRRARLTSLAASVAAMVVLTFGAGGRLMGWHVDHGVLVVYEITLIAVSLALFVDVRWGRWGSAAITSLAVDLGHYGSGGSLRDRLANALSDPTLVIGYVTPGGDGLVDEMGRPMDIAPDEPGRARTPIQDAGRPIAVMGHDSAVLDDPALLGSVATLTRIALANVRLQADVQARVAAVESSRRRLITVADAERTRLEAELRSGAQSRLEHVASLLADIPDDTGGLSTQLVTSMEAIGEFARGVHPRALSEYGLAVAISQLASTAPVPVPVSAPSRRFPREVEAAAYFVCAEALTNIAKYAHATKALIHVSEASDELVVEVVDDGIGGADPSSGSGLVGLSDRLDVLGGTLKVDSPAGGGTRIEARIPLLNR